MKQKKIQKMILDWLQDRRSRYALLEMEAGEQRPWAKAKRELFDEVIMECWTSGP
jgi:uncharacterized protein YjiS (DUF1127 family)